MGALDFLGRSVDLTSPAHESAYDELPRWSAMFGVLLLDEVPLSGVDAVLDVGCGTGFPLIELAERLGADSDAHGIDTWVGAVARARAKVAARGVSNVTVHEGSAAAMPFEDGRFALVVSNLGLNNFEDRDAAVRECRRVIRAGGRLALTTNLRGHMREFYAEFEHVLNALADPEGLRRLRAHIAHRATVQEVQQLLAQHGFVVTRVVERDGALRFASGEALMNHHFINLGFLQAWKTVAGERQSETFSSLLGRLGDLVRRDGELRLTIPMAYVEAVAVGDGGAQGT